MQNQQAKVWELLERCGIHDLPINYENLLTHREIQVVDYESGAEFIRELNLQSLTESKPGFSAKTKAGSYILYKRGLSTPERNHVLAHELGHFEEKHNDHALSAATITPEQEKEAEEYVYELSPTPVLYMAGIRTIEDVQRVTKLDTLAARTILLRMSEYNGREFTEEEHRICKQFEGFIARERKRKLRSKLRRAWAPLAVGAIASALLVTVLFTLIGNLDRQQAPVTSVASVAAPATTSEASSLPQGQIVYWTDSGDVYHIDRNCRHIRNRTNVHSGTVAESGKDRVCKTCG